MQCRWHEKGIYDVPAMIDYVLNTTQQEQLVYVGYSEGTTAFLVTASTRPEYNLKVGKARLVEACHGAGHRPRSELGVTKGVTMSVTQGVTA